MEKPKIKVQEYWTGLSLLPRRLRARRRVRWMKNGWGYIAIYIDRMPFGVTDDRVDSENTFENLMERARSYVLINNPPYPWKGWWR